MKLETVGDVVQHSRDLEQGHQLILKANTIRKERTGIHATITIARDTTLLDFSGLNIESTKDRTHLANSAYRLLGENSQALITREEFKHHLDLFCHALWPTFIKQIQASHVAGTPFDDPTGFLAEPFILEEGGTIMFGPRGGGKSYTGKLMLIAIDAGVNGLWKTQQTKTLLINLERPPRSIARRIGYVNQALGLEGERSIVVLNARGQRLADIRDNIARAVEDNGIRFGLLDSISRAGQGDLNENVPANGVMDIMNHLLPSWLALAHTARGDQSHVYGSTMFENAADVVIKLSSEQNSETKQLGVKLEVVKANDISIPKPYYLALDFDEFGLKAARRAGQQEFAGLYASENVKPAEVLYEWLTSEAGEASATDAAKELGLERSLVARTMRADKRFQGRRVGKSVLYSVKAPQEQQNY